MNYNYPQTQFQNPQAVGYGGYRAAPQYPQWPQAATASAQVRPVSSIEEVRAYPIDFDGSVFYFADMANRRIYTKQFNIDGTVSINLYELKTDQPTDSSFITRQEFENTVNQIYNKYEPLLKAIEEAQQQIMTAPPQQPQSQVQQTKSIQNFEF